MKKLLADILKSLCSHFGQFVKRIYCLVFFYGMFYVPSCGLAILIPITLRDLGMPTDITRVMTQVLLTIAPIVPTGFFTLLEKEDEFEEYSLDLCFVVWIATIVLAWTIL